jgi:hypothetical protein
MKRYIKLTCGIAALFIVLTLEGCAKPAVSPEPPPTAAPAPAAAAEPMQEPESRYTIAWMSDTQHYSNRFPDIFYAMTAYLRDAEKELNLKYVAHTGDLINNYGSERQWENAVRAMASIANIPAGVCAGNHDVKHDDALYDNFSRYFGEKQVSYRECYGGSFQDNRGHYDLIDAGSTRYLFIYMGYHVEQDGIEWIKSVLEQYPDRVAVLCTHAYFDTDLTLLADGRLLKEEIVSKYSNVYMVLSGHRYNIACVPEEFDDDGDGTPDRKAYQMICNYQAADDHGGSGYMMFFDVDEEKGVINCYTYSPVLDDKVRFDDISKKKRRYSNAPHDEMMTLEIPWELAD